MAHHIYNTKGFVLESSNTGEANKMYSLLTADVGLVRAMAQGVRLQKSKLRYSLQDFSAGTISLVRGKEIWRITSAKIDHNLYYDFKSQPATRLVVANIFNLLKRLIVGEEINKKLFELVSNALDFLYAEKLSAEEVGLFERIVVVQILHNLGYIGHKTALGDFLEGQWSRELLVAFEPKKKLALEEINNALRASQL